MGAAIGVAIARNYIGWERDGTASYDYTLDSTPTALQSGDLVLIESGARAGDVYRYVGSPLSESDDAVDDIIRSQMDYADDDTWKLNNLTQVGMPVQAYLEDSSVAAQGDLALSATATQTLEAIVVAASGAISAGTVGVGLSGAGVSADNRISANVRAYICLLYTSPSPRD